MTDTNATDITHNTPHEIEEIAKTSRLVTILGYGSVKDLDNEDAVHLDSVNQDDYENGDYDDDIAQYEDDFYHVSVLNDQGKSVC